jgi:hypothetical protein
MSRHTLGKGPQHPRLNRAVSNGVEASRQEIMDRASPERGKESNSRATAIPQVKLPHRLTPEQEFQLIQMRAYYLWQQAGSPVGDAARDRFWLQAQREVECS